MNVHLQEWGKAILQAAVIIVILFFFCWPMRISGSSMESTMKDGEIVESGDVEQVYFHPEHPYTKKLLEAAGILEEGD